MADLCCECLAPTREGLALLCATKHEAGRLAHVEELLAGGRTLGWHLKSRLSRLGGQPWARQRGLGHNGGVSRQSHRACPRSPAAAAAARAEHHRRAAAAGSAASGTEPPSVVRGLLVRYRLEGGYHLRQAQRAEVAPDGSGKPLFLVQVCADRVVDHFNG